MLRLNEDSFGFGFGFFMVSIRDISHICFCAFSNVRWMPQISHFSNITVLSQTQACSCTHTHTHTHIPWPDQTQLNNSKVSALDHHPLLSKINRYDQSENSSQRPPFPLASQSVCSLSFLLIFFFYLLCYLSKSLCDSPFHRILPKTLAAARFVREPRTQQQSAESCYPEPHPAPLQPPPTTATHFTKKWELFAGKKKSLIPFWGRRCVMRKMPRPTRDLFIFYTLFYFNYLLN